MRCIGSYTSRWTDWGSWCPDGGWGVDGVEVLIDKGNWKGGRWWSERDSWHWKMGAIIFLQVTQYYFAELGFKPGLSALESSQHLCSALRAEPELHQLRESPLALVVSSRQMRTHSFPIFIAPHRTAMWNFASLSPLLPLLTEIETGSDELGCFHGEHMFADEEKQTRPANVKTWGPLWVWGLNISFWCLCLCGFLHQSDHYPPSPTPPLGVVDRGTHPLQILTIF